MSAIYSKRLECPTPDNETAKLEVHAIILDPVTSRDPEPRPRYLGSIEWSGRRRVLSLHTDREDALEWAVDHSKLNPATLFELPFVPMMFKKVDNSRKAQILRGEL